MRKRFNTVVVDEVRGFARLIWVEPETLVSVEQWETPFSIVADGKLVDVEIIVEHDVREFALRERKN